MTHPAHKPNIFTWKRLTKTPSSNKVQLTDGDINQWMKRVEMASEFAVSEVFSPQKVHTAKLSQAVALQSMEQLQDHDDAYSEAQAILSDWMNSKLRLELEVDEDQEELTDSSNKESPEKTATLSYNNFEDMYSRLAQEDESFEVNNFLQDLMEREVLDSGEVEGLRLDTEVERKRRDPGLTMQLRHQQVKERRLRRDAEREKHHKEQEVKKEAREEAQRLEREEQRRRKLEARKQEELIQQEMIRLRRHLEDKRNMEQLARKMERERLETQRASERSGMLKSASVTEKQLQCREQEMEAKAHILNLQCIQKHFSAWYSVVLEKRVRLGKAAALCDWRRQLRAWRAWRALVWVKREEREAERTEEELRMENRRCQVAEESDRRRLLRRSLNDWRLWCRMEKERKDLLKQKEETRRKMVALITAATSGKLSSENCTDSPVTAIPDVPIKPENHIQPTQLPLERTTSAPAPSTLTDRKASPPTQAWQVTRRHAALSPAELRQAHQRQPPNNAPRCQSAERGGRFEHRHLAQQQTIAEQRRLLKEQQELILHLQERQNFLDFRQEAERHAESAVPPLKVPLKPSARHCITQSSTGGGETGISSNGTSRADTSNHTNPKVTASRPVAPHPAVRAMEERAQLRAERRREVEEMKKRREEDKLAQMKAAEEERLRQEEEEKRMAAERRKEERRQQKERELEKQKRIERKQKLLKQAQEHYQRSLLLHRGLAPWKRLLEKSRTNSQKAKDHHSHVLQRQCLLSWLQTAGDALAEKVACANQLYTNILLRRAFCNWKRFMHLQCILEAQADRFFRAQALRKGFTALLDHATHQRLLSWTKEQQAEEHNDRRLVRRCLSGWIRLPAALREERVREERRERLRRKVAEILPDFRSSPVDGLWSPAPSH
ncbi:coiled-coil domain-containing protein 191 [Astyanax mexicanus]|uniref:Coiled-coil domain-containing protein 191 n=1 Tax=Astyanax mexicanus TaxID=7994 RepID=A0A8T2MFU3_ASTMX|nr:coiled-coil domain-containing protein 191 [Astyanax mexicanus]